MDPYEVLGLSGTATFAQVRARYFELAKLHHPDKLQNVSEVEKQTHEDYFKKVTVAYADIERRKDGSAPHRENPDDWRSVWSRMESIFQQPGMWQCVKDTLLEVATKSLQIRNHCVKVPVTLEEIQSKKSKKLRLFLSHIDEPVFITINTGDYPAAQLEHELSTGLKIDILAEFCIQPHPTYRHDDVLDSWDLYATVKTTWLDYFTGRALQLPALDSAQPPIDIKIEPFSTYEGPIVIEDKGLCGLGNLYISVEMAAPDAGKDVWDAQSPELQNKHIAFLNALYNNV